MVDRRRFLTACGAAATVGLAGCTGDGDDGGSGGGSDGGDGGSDGGDGDDSTPTDTEETAEEYDQVVAVGPGGELRFDPAEATVSQGATVQWVWEGDFHSVTPDSQPAGENWGGTGEETHDEGYTHVHTFSTTGTYEYFCRPHKGSGMVGTLTVE